MYNSLIETFKPISKKKIKYLKKIQKKNYRISEKVFIVEGEKSVNLLLKSNYRINFLVCTEQYITRNITIINSITDDIEVFCTSHDIMCYVSNLKTNDSVLAVVYTNDDHDINDICFDNYILVLDRISDPSNLGAIIRVADWYGIKDIVCSYHTVDMYNPKVIQSSMGSFINVNLFYADLVNFLQNISADIPVYGTLLEGESIYDVSFNTNGVIVMGNESCGINSQIVPLLTKKITIPRRGNANSLNVAVAAGIICDNIFKS